MHSRVAVRPELWKRLIIAAGVVLAAAVVTAIVQPGFSAQGAPSAQDEDGATPVLLVQPPIVMLPEAGSRLRDHGVYLIGGGLEAGQEFTIRIRWNSEGLEQDVTPFLIGYNDETGALANVHGAFTAGFGQGLQDFREPRRDLFFQGVFGTISFRLHDAETGALLAVAPLGLCGPNREAAYCLGAEPMLPIED